jgi:hypothetical protein
MRRVVPAVVVSWLGVDQRWQGRGFGGLVMWQALGIAAVGPVVRARLVVAHGVTGQPRGFLSRVEFRAFTTRADRARVQQDTPTTSHTTMPHSTRS